MDQHTWNQCCEDVAHMAWVVPPEVFNYIEKHAQSTLIPLTTKPDFSANDIANMSFFIQFLGEMLFLVDSSASTVSSSTSNTSLWNSKASDITTKNVRTSIYRVAPVIEDLTLLESTTMLDKLLDVFLQILQSVNQYFCNSQNSPPAPITSASLPAASEKAGVLRQIMCFLTKWVCSSLSHNVTANDPKNTGDHALASSKTKRMLDAVVNTCLIVLSTRSLHSDKQLSALPLPHSHTSSLYNMACDLLDTLFGFEQPLFVRLYVLQSTDVVFDFTLWAVTQLIPTSSNAPTSPFAHLDLSVLVKLCSILFRFDQTSSRSVELLNAIKTLIESKKVGHRPYRHDSLQPYSTPGSPNEMPINGSLLQGLELSRSVGHFRGQQWSAMLQVVLDSILETLGGLLTTSFIFHNDAGFGNAKDENRTRSYWKALWDVTSRATQAISMHTQQMTPMQVQGISYACRKSLDILLRIGHVNVNEHFAEAYRATQLGRALRTLSGIADSLRMNELIGVVNLVGQQLGPSSIYIFNLLAYPATAIPYLAILDRIASDATIQQIGEARLTSTLFPFATHDHQAVSTKGLNLLQSIVLTYTPMGSSTSQIPPASPALADITSVQSFLLHRFLLSPLPLYSSPSLRAASDCLYATLVRSRNTFQHLVETRMSTSGHDQDASAQRTAQFLSVLFGRGLTFETLDESSRDIFYDNVLTIMAQSRFFRCK